VLVNAAVRLEEADTVRFEHMSADAATALLAVDVIGAPEIRVNAIAPGPITGNWEQEWGVAPKHIEEAKAMNPMKRFGDPREIAETVLFLASDGAGYVNGQVIHVEGGWVPAG